jgi:hypothetical protein
MPPETNAMLPAVAISNRETKSHERAVLVLAHPAGEHEMPERLAERARFAAEIHGTSDLVGYRQLRRSSVAIEWLLDAVRTSPMQFVAGRSAAGRLSFVELFEFASEHAAIACLRSRAARRTWDVLGGEESQGRPQALLCRLRVVAPPSPQGAQITAMLFIRARPSSSLGEMQRYWWDEHRSLVTRLAPRLRYDAYRQFHRAITRPEGGWSASPYDGIAALSFDGLGRLLRTLASPGAYFANAALLHDEQNFVDPHDASLFLGQEEVIF